ncbi:MAG: porin [Litoreibacter sp.]
MKNVLFASTALVALTGAAAADVALSGRAEMGVFGETGAAEAQFFTDIDVTFTLTGETDNGLTFGASVDLDEGGSGAAAVADNSDDGGIVIFVSGDFGTVSIGDTDGALDWALTEAGNIGNPGTIADDETSHAGYLGSYGDGQGGDGQILRYDYSAGDFGVAISAESNEDANGNADDYGYAVGLRYNLNLTGAQVKLGIGYQSTVDDQDIIGVSATAILENGISAGFTYADYSDSVNDYHVGVGVGYTTGAITLHANYGIFELDAGGDVEGGGISAAYDLGGGAVVHAGYSDGAGIERASLGLGLSF